MNMGFEVLGANQVIAAMAASAILGEVAAEAAVFEIKNEIVQIAQQLVPKDTYELHDSIKITPDGVEAGADHAAPVEYGSVSHPAPQPFLRPAVDLATESYKGSAAMAILARGGKE